MSDLNTLVAQMRRCTLCRDLPLGPNPIFQLDARVKVLVVGQAPGRRAHEAMRPFQDPSGDRLRRWMGIEAAQFYEDPRVGIFPMGLCFPGTGVRGDLPPRAICAQTWRVLVMDALRAVELTLVLGAHAVAWHRPDLKGMALKQAVAVAGREEDGTFVLPHPSPRNNRWLKQNPWFEAEIVPRIRSAVREALAG